MRNELKEVFKALLANSERVVIDNDFEAAYNIITTRADSTQLLEVIYILLAIVKENEIDLEKIYDI